MSAIEELGRQRVLPVLRCADADDTLATARAAAAAGCRVVEVTMSTPGVEDAIEPLVADGLIVAVGTVRDAQDVVRLADAGASLVVSFWNPPGFVAAATAAGIAAIPGGFTAHELAAAYADGATVAKLFPASLAGPDFLFALRPLLPDLQLLVTGGIAAEGVGPWLDAGALAVGLGTNLGTAGTVGAAEVERRCRAALAAA
ncbi:MAG TPA: bifunctional 4-hydroxy-2-oxoglutarate aldolase/2-dehydro-3-deoxy-phosphogluconate aldolase [Gaiellaceae bacterium]|nr:bifunctional 4-hydroxy-2-oxoglutarate aldolase/2-dehydro-3-deoxy-phosphogluconate aldolase [Gaiellaceae bacterium]